MMTAPRVWTDVDLPTTDAELYDLLQRLFGIGGFDDITTGNERWHQARMREIAKIKGQRKARGTSIADLAIAAIYCHHHGIHVFTTAPLYKHIRAAKAAWIKSHREREQANHHAAYAEAIEHESHAVTGDDYWLSRLLRSNNPEQTLTEWKKARGQ